MTSNDVTTKTTLMRNITAFAKNTYVAADEGESEEAFHIRTIRMLLVVVFIGIYASITITCNALALAILFKKTFMRNAFAIGQRVLAILDLILAFTVLLKYFIKGSSALDFSTWDTTACRMYKTFYYTIVGSVNWSIVYLSSVRLVALRYPLKVNTHSFIRRAYISLMCATTIVSLFFAIMYHEVARVLASHAHPSSVEECFSYKDFPINEYVFRTSIMLVETILPAILIVIVNTLTYREYRNVSIKRDQLKDAVLKHSENISAIKRSLETSDKGRTTFTGVLGRSSLIISSVTRNMPNYRTLFGSFRKSDVSPGISSDLPGVNDDQGIFDNPQSREDLLLKLKYERLHLRRATRAYETLLEAVTESMPMSYRSRESSCEVSLESEEKQMYCVVQKDILPPERESTVQHVIEPQNRMKMFLIITTLIFIVLNIPSCCYYIITPWFFNETSVGFERYMLGVAIVHILMCFGHTSNFFVYIFSSSKIKVQALELLEKNRFYKSDPFK